MKYGRCMNCGCYDSPGTVRDEKWITCGTCKVTTLAHEWCVEDKPSDDRKH
jgi:hypothetical protein